jgi:hypothetical protein
MNKKRLIIRIIVWTVCTFAILPIFILLRIIPAPQLCTNELVPQWGVSRIIVRESLPGGPESPGIMDEVVYVIDCESYPIITSLMHFIDPYNSLFNFPSSHIEWHKVDSRWFRDNYRTFKLFLKFNHL